MSKVKDWIVLEGVLYQPYYKTPSKTIQSLTLLMK